MWVARPMSSVHWWMSSFDVIEPRATLGDSPHQSMSRVPAAIVYAHRGDESSEVSQQGAGPRRDAG